MYTTGEEWDSASEDNTELYQPWTWDMYNNMPHTLVLCVALCTLCCTLYLRNLLREKIFSLISLVPQYITAHNAHAWMVQKLQNPLNLPPRKYTATSQMLQVFVDAQCVVCVLLNALPHQRPYTSEHSDSKTIPLCKILNIRTCVWITGCLCTRQVHINYSPRTTLRTSFPGWTHIHTHTMKPRQRALPTVFTRKTLQAILKSS